MLETVGKGGKTAEIELILCCSRTRLEPQHTERIYKITERPVDWNRIIFLAEHHRITPLLYQNLKKIESENIPSDIYDWLLTRLHANFRNSLLMVHELFGLLDQFKAESIPVIPFKGPVLAAVYGHLKLRPFTDLDLLVHRKDVLRARTLLIEQQFDEVKPLPSDFARSRKNFIPLRNPWGNANGYLRKNQTNFPLRIDLHWDLAPRYFSNTLKTEALWENLRPVKVLNRTLLTFSWEQTLLHLTLHGTIHRWTRLRLICDIAEVLRAHPDMDWSWLTREARERHMERMLFLALFLAHHLLAAPLPELIIQLISKNKIVSSLGFEVFRRLFQPFKGVRRIRASYRFDLLVHDRSRDGIGSCIYHTWMALKSTGKKKGWADFAPPILSF